MSRHIHLVAHLSIAELELRYRAAHKSHEPSLWQMLWLLACGQTAMTIADTIGYSHAWIARLIARSSTVDAGENNTALLAEYC